jgi:hypothetical protein
MNGPSAAAYCWGRLFVVGKGRACARPTSTGTAATGRDKVGPGIAHTRRIPGREISRRTLRRSRRAESLIRGPCQLGILRLHLGSRRGMQCHFHFRPS